mgnify:CR=1 FL=1
MRSSILPLTLLLACTGDAQDPVTDTQAVPGTTGAPADPTTSAAATTSDATTASSPPTAATSEATEPARGTTSTPDETTDATTGDPLPARAYDLDRDGVPDTDLSLGPCLAAPAHTCLLVASDLTATTEVELAALHAVGTAALRQHQNAANLLTPFAHVVGVDLPLGVARGVLRVDQDDESSLPELVGQRAFHERRPRGPREASTGPPRR